MKFPGFRIPEPSASPVIKSWMRASDREELRQLGDVLSLAQRTILSARMAGRPVVLAASHGTGCRTAIRWADGIGQGMDGKPMAPGLDPAPASAPSSCDILLQRGVPDARQIPADIPEAARFHVHTTDLRNVRIYAPWRDVTSPDPEYVRTRVKAWLAERRAIEPVVVLYGDAIESLPSCETYAPFTISGWPQHMPRGCDLVLWNPPMQPGEWLRACAATGDFAAGGAGCTILVDSTPQLCLATALKWLLLEGSPPLEGDDRAAVAHAWHSLSDFVRDRDRRCKFGGESAVLELVTRLGLNRGNAWVILNAVREGAAPG